MLRNRTQALMQLRPFIERARAFSGWSVDDIDVRPLDPLFDGQPTPWDYTVLARDLLAPASGRVIDLGTGGGEVYARVISGLDGPACFASEEWHVNAPIARARLAPLGVQVVRASSVRTPWADASFDVVLSRHEAIAPEEIARILAPGGVFLTQQVAGENWHELSPFFPYRTVFADHFTDYARGFGAAGFRVETRHHTWRAAFATLGEVVFWLLVTPDEFPGFDPVREIDTLLALEDAHGTAEGIVLTEARYLLRAERVVA